MAFLERNRIQRFILLSTGGAIYGNRRLAKEEDAYWQTCLSPYAQSKFLAEVIVRHSIRDHLILRLANVYGGACSLRGEAALHQHFAEDNPIRIYGGQQTRDFIHKDDVCAALRWAMESGITGTFNIGSGREKSIAKLAAEFSAKRGVPISYQAARPGEVEYTSLDCAKAHAAGLHKFCSSPSTASPKGLDQESNRSPMERVETCPMQD